MSGLPRRQPIVSPISLPELQPGPVAVGERTISVLNDVPATVTVVAGRASMTLKEVRALEEGDIVRLDRSPDATVDIYVNGLHVARGDVIVLDDTIAARVSDIDPLKVVER